MITTYDTNDPRLSAMRVITPSGRFNYNRSFDINTLPKINGVPVISNMDLETIGICPAALSTIDNIIKGCWHQYGVFIPTNQK